MSDFNCKSEVYMALADEVTVPCVVAPVGGIIRVEMCCNFMRCYELPITFLSIFNLLRD